MPDYRRSRVPSGTYFFTVNLLSRNSQLLTTHIDALRKAVGVAQQRLPFHIDAWVVLPEHMHCVWTLPAGNDNYAARWKIIKIEFAKQIPKTESLSPIRRKKENAPSGNDVIGNTRYAMSAIMRRMWIMCISIH